MESAHHSTGGRIAAAVTAGLLALASLTAVAAPASAATEEYTVSGTVSVGEGGDPGWLAGVTVTAWPASGATSPVDVGVNATTGDFTFRGLPAGEYYVSADAVDPAVVEAWYGDADAGGPLDPLVVDGDLDGVYITLAVGATVRGSVSLPPELSDAEHYRAVEVELRRLEQGVSVDVITRGVDADGRFAVRGVMPGDYLITVREVPFFQEAETYVVELPFQRLRGGQPVAIESGETLSLGDTTLLVGENLGGDRHVVDPPFALEAACTPSGEGALTLYRGVSDGRGYVATVGDTAPAVLGATGDGGRTYAFDDETMRVTVATTGGNAVFDWELEEPPCSAPPEWLLRPRNSGPLVPIWTLD